MGVDPNFNLSAQKDYQYSKSGYIFQYKPK